MCYGTAEQSLRRRGNGTSGGSRIFCLGGLMGRGFLFGGLMGIKRRRRETTIAEGKKALTTRGDGGGGGGSRTEKKKNRDDFEHFKPKYSTFLDPGNLTFLNN